MENSGNESMRDDRGLGFLTLLRNPRNLSDGFKSDVGRREGVRRDRRLHLLKSVLEHCEPLAGALWQWHSLGRSLV